MGVNKVIRGDGRTVIDISNDTVTAAGLANGLTAHNSKGEVITGENTFDADTSDATATAAEILNTKTAYVRGNKVVGTMPNIGKATGAITDVTTGYQIPRGFHDGTGTVNLSATDLAKLTPANIRKDVTIGGIKGEMSGTEGENKQSKTVTPAFEVQSVLPDDPYTCLSEVTVSAIPYTETANAAGGITVTIG